MAQEEESQPNSSQLTKETPKRPGGSLRARPLEINGTFYDPLHPPKLIRTPDGKESYIGGQKIDKDEAYSMMFWARHQPGGLREAMLESLDSSIKSGVFSSFADATKGPDGRVELGQESRERLSAFRILARERGYTIGPYKYNESAGTVQATIGKSQPLQK